MLLQVGFGFRLTDPTAVLGQVNDLVESGVKIYNACPENLNFQLEISCHHSR